MQWPGAARQATQLLRWVKQEQGWIASLPPRAAAFRCPGVACLRPPLGSQAIQGGALQPLLGPAASCGATSGSALTASCVMCASIFKGLGGTVASCTTDAAEYTSHASYK